MKVLAFGFVATVSLFMLARPDYVAPDTRERLSLSSPAGNAAVDGVGRAEIRANDSQQTFMVELGLDVSDGMPLFEFENGELGEMVGFNDAVDE